MADDIDYPEHEKMKALGTRRDAVESFLDWLLDEREPKVVLAHWPDEDTPTKIGQYKHELNPVTTGKEDLMAEHFGIDLKVIEQEKRQMLDEMRKANAERDMAGS